MNEKIDLGIKVWPLNTKGLLIYTNENKDVVEVQKYINNLQSKIDKTNRILNANTHVENIYHALCNLFDEEYQYEIDNEELNKILKEDK